MKKSSKFDKKVFASRQSTLSERKQKLIQNATPSEIRIMNLLTQLKIRAMFQKGFIHGDYYCIVDFFLPKYHLCIEVDGFYHDKIEQKKRDRRKDYYLIQDRGFMVLRIPNRIADTMTINELQDLILGKTKHGLTIVSFLK